MTVPANALVPPVPPCPLTTPAGSAPVRPLAFKALLLPLLAALAIVAVVYWPVLSARSFSSDDDQYVVNNPLVQKPSWASAQRVFSEVLKPTIVTGYYQPLPMVSLMLDTALGASPADLSLYRRTSFVLHLLNVGLLIVLIHLLFAQPWVAAIVGLLFGVHPLTVESVAWIAERKTLLATFFSFFCIILYVRGIRRPERGGRLHAAALLALVLALLCKPIAIPLPVVLLLLDYWPLRRLTWRTALAKVPYFGVAAVGAIIASVSQARVGGVVTAGSPTLIPLLLGHNIVFYSRQILWPTAVTSYYPVPEPLAFTHPAVLVGVIGAAVLLVVLLVSWRWTRAMLVGWLVFLVAVLPTMGPLRATEVIAANRYVYFPMLGFALISGWLLSHLWTRAPAGALTSGRGGLLLACGVLVVLAAFSTRAQLGHWQTTEGLHRYMLQYAPKAGALHLNLAAALKATQNDRKVPEVMLHLEAASECTDSPGNAALGHLYLGRLLANRGRFEEAIFHLKAATKNSIAAQDATADLPRVLGALGKSVGQARDPAVARRVLPLFRARVAEQPDSAAAHDQYAALLDIAGQLDEAAYQFSEAIRLDPTVPYTHIDYGTVLVRLNRLQEAEFEFRTALRLDPDNPAARSELERILRHHTNRPADPAASRPSPAGD